MKRMKLGLLALTGVLALSACEGKNTKTTTTTPTTTPVTTQQEETFSIKYTNFMGKSTTETFVIDGKKSVLDCLKSKFTVQETGGYITKINDSFIDSNWAIMIYENGQMASTGVKDLIVDNGDEFEFKFEFWNTIESSYGVYDSYEVLVDQIIYDYAINKLPNKISAMTTFDSSSYWEEMALYKMINAKNSYGNLYDTSIFNTDDFSDAFKKTITDQDVTKLTDNSFFKYYYAARLFDTNLDAFKTSYSSYLETLTEFESFGEYKYPFMLSTAKTLGLSDKISSAIKNPSSTPDALSFGPDGLSWLYTGMLSAGTFNSTNYSNLTLDTLTNSYNKDTSLSSMILPFVANNTNPRLSIKDNNDRDIIQILLDDYFNLETFKFETEASDSDYSSNQIYAALIAYKVFRDTASATNLFE